MNWLDKPLFYLSPGKQDAATIRTVMAGILVLGASGSGKTSGPGDLIAKALLRAGIGLLVLTYKKDEAARWLKMAEQCGRSKDVRLINPSSEGFISPLQYLYEKGPKGELFHVVDFITQLQSIIYGVGQSQGGENQFWRDAERERLSRTLEVLIAAKRDLTFTNIERFILSTPRQMDDLANEAFLNSSFCVECLQQVLELYGKDSQVFQKMDYYFTQDVPTADPRTRSNLEMGLKAILTPLTSSEMVSRLFSKTILTPEDIFNGGIAILDVPVQLYGIVGRLLQGAFRFCFQLAGEWRNTQDYPIPSVQFIDEFQRFYYPYDSEAVLTGRSNLLGNVFISQSISALNSALGSGSDAKDRTISLTGNLSTKFFCATNEYNTAEFMSKTIGAQKTYTSSFGAQLGKQDSMSSSMQEQILPQVETTEFSLLRTGGPQNDFFVDCYVTSTGMRFSNGKNHIKTTFQQTS